jgi:hypothetical protein
MEVSFLLLQAKARLSRHHFFMFEIDVDNCFDVGSQQSMVPIAARAYMSMLSDCFMSYNRFLQPYKFYELPLEDCPLTQFSSHVYHEMTGFCLEQLEVIN